MGKDVKIFVAGHSGMVGSSIVRELKKIGYFNIVTANHADLDLIDQNAVKTFFENEKPDQVYLAAAIAGGIHANNSLPAQFIYENLMIQSNIIHQSWLSGVKKLLFLGSSCIYPKLASQPMSEKSLLESPLELTNEPYAVAKIAGIKMCESYNRQYGEKDNIDYRCVMPTNLYGIGDKYHNENSHVIPALIRRFHEAKILNTPNVEIWGTGKPMREFLYVDDLSSAAIFIMNLSKDKYLNIVEPQRIHINVGSGKDITIKDLAFKIAEVVEYEGEIIFDKTKLDGTPRKLMDSSLIKTLGWKDKISFDEGLKLAYEDYKLNYFNN